MNKFEEIEHITRICAATRPFVAPEDLLDAADADVPKEDVVEEFYLRDGRRVRLLFPGDLPRSEGRRVAAWVQSLMAHRE